MMRAGRAAMPATNGTRIDIARRSIDGDATPRRRSSHRSTIYGKAEPRRDGASALIFEADEHAFTGAEC